MSQAVLMLLRASIAEHPACVDRWQSRSNPALPGQGARVGSLERTRSFQKKAACVCWGQGQHAWQPRIDDAVSALAQLLLADDGLTGKA